MKINKTYIIVVNFLIVSLISVGMSTLFFSHAFAKYTIFSEKDETSINKINNGIQGFEINNNIYYEIFPATIIQVADSLGNINTNSWTDDFRGDWSCYPDCPDLELEVGESIIFTVTASDPNGLPLEYKFDYQPSGGSFITLQDWSSSNIFEWNVSPDAIGPNIVVAIHVRNNDGQEWQGPGLGDDYTYAIYKVIDPNTSPAILTEVVDSLGNINTNSWTDDFRGDWSCYPDCPDLELEVGESIIFTVTASDPNGLALEYKFDYQPSGGSFITLQDWSSSNIFEWNVSPDAIGPNIVVAIHVRNNDGQEWQGPGLGDDYTYATYEVIDPSTYAATLTEVIDSLGNINTNSWTKETGGGWSCYPNCPDLELRVGEIISFIVSASDPNNLPLEYRFYYMRNGSMTIAQDWSNNNNFEWHVSLEDVGPCSGISIHVRNNDGQEWQGTGLGDDYTYATYTVYNMYIDDIDPESTITGTSELTMIVNGSNFSEDSVLQFGDTSLTTSFVDTKTLNVEIPNSLLQSPGTYSIKVINAKIESETSNEKTFTVNTLLFLPFIMTSSN